VDQAGQLASFSNFSRTKVMLAAPGVRIKSCSSLPYHTRTDSGTSFLAPNVAATLAMMVNRFPWESYFEIIDRLRLKLSVDPDDFLELKTIPGGRLNIDRALGIEL